MRRRLAPPKGRTIRLPPVRPNVGIEAAYRKRLDDLIREMQAAVVYWVRAAYRAHPPAMAQDASAAVELNRAVQVMARRWQKKFDDLGPRLARSFATSAAQRSDASMRALLKRSGMAVEFKMTREANDALQAVIAENVGLIKSIASEHLSEVQGLVMRAASRGGDVGTLTNELEARYGITRRRAAFIARDQNNKATAVIQRVRQTELGITKAMWLHSAGGRHPRQSHIDASRKTYEVSKGMLIDGEFILPGQLPNCRCVSVSVIEGFD